MRVKAKLIYESHTARWTISCPYNKAWVDEFKALVHFRARSWDAVLKVWTVDEMFLDAVKELCNRHFDGWEDCTPPPATPPPPAQALNGGAALVFLRTCPADAVKKLYREAALALHPDKGGDGEAMARLNAAWDALRPELGL